MKLKKLFFLNIIFVLLANFRTISVFAQEDASILQPIEKLVGPLFKLDLLAGNETWLLRFLLWIIVFSLFYFGSTKIFPSEHKSIGITISIVLALISALFVPVELLNGLFQTYGFLIPFAIYVLPLVGLLYIGHTVERSKFGRGLRAAIFGVAFYFFGMIGETVLKGKTGLTSTVLSKGLPVLGWTLSDINGIVIAALFILALWNLIKVFGKSEEEEEISDKASELGQWIKEKSPWSKEKQEVKKQGQAQKNIAKQRLRGISRGMKKDVNHIIKELNKIKDTLDQIGEGSSAAKTIKKAIQNIATRESRIDQEIKVVKQAINEVKTLQGTLTNEVNSAQAADLKIKKGQTLQAAKAAARKKIITELEINTKGFWQEEKDFEEDTKAFEALNGTFKDNLKDAENEIQAKDLKKAQDYIQRAIQNEEDSKAILQTLVNKGAKLVRLSGKEDSLRRSIFK